MPEPASTRSLEDILASIRRSLADESVDGLVELSAEAVDAARAEQTRTTPARETVQANDRPTEDQQVPSASDALADDLLRDKLAGALVLDTDLAEEEIAAEDEATSAQPVTDPIDAADEEPTVDPATLAKLWVSARV